MSTPAPTPTSTKPSSLAAFGDSITRGCCHQIAGSDWPSQVAAATGMTVDNEGIGAQTSTQVAVRMNAYAGTSAQTFASAFTIPTSGSVTVAFPPGDEPCYQAGIQGPAVQLATVVSGVSYEGSCTQTGSTYSFTPATYPASAVSVPAGNAWTAVLGEELSGCVSIEAGRNNYQSPSVVLADIAAMVAVAEGKTSCWSVMTIINSDLEPMGTADYNTIQSENATLSSLYGSHVVDIRSALVSHYDPTFAPDVADHGNDVPPLSLKSGWVLGTLTAPIADTSTCTFSISASPGANGVILTVDSEDIRYESPTTCVRGAYGTSPATHASGASVYAIDWLHPGANTYSSQNTNCAGTGGYSCIAQQYEAWLAGQGTSSDVVTFPAAVAAR